LKNTHKSLIQMYYTCHQLYLTYWDLNLQKSLLNILRAVRSKMVSSCHNVINNSLKKSKAPTMSLLCNCIDSSLIGLGICLLEVTWLFVANKPAITFRLSKIPKKQRGNIPFMMWYAIRILKLVFSCFWRCWRSSMLVNLINNKSWPMQSIEPKSLSNGKKELRGLSNDLLQTWRISWLI